ncbi:alpha/beta hydrolase [Novosphingobium sp. KACC 22771]|uniref:alpha/beta hydrolase n=1 Tax=Novosphingobium sp. KACC 22771 TaxID=3025670 RepID=UPI0023658FF3|nr:alpha/beta hydrolase [Novosphingobium sp. KACC 22771]WDF73336.1 alpha/beta hydrolase [Novosphingobium sp. KACC 22771]
MTSIRQSIAAMGQGLGPDVLEACRQLFAPEQEALAAAVPVAARDLAYGPHERHRLDLYGAAEGALKPVLLFVHGGAFVMGDKGDTSWPNAAVGRMAAQRGWIGAVMNYRLAPDHLWPAGSEDVAAAVDFLRATVAEHGGDPDRIVVMGTSAGAVHVSGFLKLRTDHGDLVRGAVLLSGLYGCTPLDPKDERYYGTGDYAAMSPLAAVVESEIPLLVACSQYDPARFQAEFLGLMQARLARHGAMPRAILLPGHNHYTMAMHLGTSDTRLEEEIAAFLEDIL